MEKSLKSALRLLLDTSGDDDRVSTSILSRLSKGVHQIDVDRYSLDSGEILTRPIPVVDSLQRHLDELYLASVSGEDSYKAAIAMIGPIGPRVKKRDLKSHPLFRKSMPELIQKNIPIFWVGVHSKKEQRIFQSLVDAIKYKQSLNSIDKFYYPITQPQDIIYTFYQISNQIKEDARDQVATIIKKHKKRATRFKIKANQSHLYLDLIGPTARPSVSLFLPNGQKAEPISYTRAYSLYRFVDPNPGLWVVKGKSPPRSKMMVGIRSVALDTTPVSENGIEGGSQTATEAEVQKELAQNPNQVIYIFQKPSGGDPPGAPITLKVEAKGGDLPSATDFTIYVERPDGAEDTISIPRVSKRLYMGDYRKTELPGKYSFYIKAPSDQEVRDNEQSLRTEDPNSKKEERRSKVSTTADELVQGWLWPVLLGGAALALMGFFWLKRKRYRDADFYEEDEEDEQVYHQSAQPKSDVIEPTVSRQEQPNRPANKQDAAVDETCFLKPSHGNASGENVVDEEERRFLADIVHKMINLCSEISGLRFSRKWRPETFDHQGIVFGGFQNFEVSGHAGKIAIVGDEDGSAALARAVFGMEPDEILEPPDIQEAIKEYMNMLSGKLKIAAQDDKAKIDLPQDLSDTNAHSEFGGCLFQALHLESGGTGQVALMWAPKREE